jgi:hypothetical protein
MQENEKKEFVALPAWTEDFSKLFVTLQKSYPFLGQPEISFPEQEDHNRAKIEIPLLGSDVLLVSCTGKNELDSALVFYLALVNQGDGFSLHHHELRLKLGISPGSDDELYGDAMNHVLGTELRKLLNQYGSSRRTAIP